MRVLQIIDSLHAGGAERMAVNYANALAHKIEFSGIVVTREEGVLQNQLHTEVFYTFLNKKATIDFASIFRLKKIIIEHKIDILHAHGTSFFTAFLLKIFYFKIKIVLHEHYGGRSNQNFFKNISLLFCSVFFNKILVVTKELEQWFLKKRFSKVVFFSNFAAFDEKDTSVTTLKGNNNKRIVCLANLKNPKNHHFLIQAFHQSDIIKEGWSLHLVGKDYKDQYSGTLLKQIDDLGINNNVYLYDAKSDIKNILSQSTIGVLCSSFEGFPVTLLEYGLAKLAVISSAVGFCSEVIIDNETGLLFNPNSFDKLTLSLKKLSVDEKLRDQLATNLNTLVLQNFNQEIVILKLIMCYKEVVYEN
jgi:glycosyltransferase involved in cell wall biosynthesis